MPTTETTQQLLLHELQMAQARLDMSEEANSENKKNKTFLYGSIGVNSILVIAVMFYFMGWIAILLIYALAATFAAGFFFFRQVNIVNDYKDLIEAYQADNQEIVGKLSPYLAEDSYFSYSDEVKDIVSATNAFAKRLVQRQQQLKDIAQVENRGKRTKKKNGFWSKLSLFSKGAPEPPEVSDFRIPIGGNPGEKSLYESPFTEFPEQYKQLGYRNSQVR